MICVGNSLALSVDATAAAEALRQMFIATRPGCVVIAHVLNLWKFPPGPCVWQKITRGTPAQGRSFILKGIHRCQHEGYVELVVAADDVDKPSIRSHSVRFLGLRAAELEVGRSPKRSGRRALLRRP